MQDTDYFKLQEQYGGKYVMRRDAEVIIAADTFDELMAEFDRRALVPAGLIVEYVYPADRVHVY
jgi:hypothetical protein